MITDLNVDPIEGTEILSLVGVNPDHLGIPQVFQKVRDVIGFFQGKTDKGYIISKLLAGKPGIDRLDHVWKYSQLRRELDEKKHNFETFINNLTDLQSRLNGTEPPEVVADLFNRETTLRELKMNDIRQLEQEISFYEK